MKFSVLKHDVDLCLQEEGLEKKVDLLVLTIPNENYTLYDTCNLTAALTKAGLGLDHAALIASDVWTRAPLSGMTYPLPQQDVHSVFARIHPAGSWLKLYFSLF